MSIIDDYGRTIIVINNKETNEDITLKKSDIIEMRKSIKRIDKILSKISKSVINKD